MVIDGCPVVMAVSSVTVQGDRRWWFELTVRRTGRDTGGHRCQLGDTEGANGKHFGRWVASSAELSQYVLWRVHDGDWYIDMTLGAGVAYDSATLIVKAIRRQTLVNQIPFPFRGAFRDTLPVVDASDIRAISKDRERQVYEVTTGQHRRYGLALSVSIVAGQVLVRNIGTWID